MSMQLSKNMIKIILPFFVRKCQFLSETPQTFYTLSLYPRPPLGPKPPEIPPQILPKNTLIAALDVIVVTPMRQDLVEAAATNPGHALSVKYDEKLNGAEELCRRQGMAFFPLAAETFGGWHRVGEREVKKLGSALARHTGQEESEAVHHLWGRLAILLQRGNAAILGNRVPNFPLPQVDGLH